LPPLCIRGKTHPDGGLFKPFGSRGYIYAPKLSPSAFVLNKYHL